MVEAMLRWFFLWVIDRDYHRSGRNVEPGVGVNWDMVENCVTRWVRVRSSPIYIELENEIRYDIDNYH